LGGETKEDGVSLACEMSIKSDRGSVVSDFMVVWLCFWSGLGSPVFKSCSSARLPPDHLQKSGKALLFNLHEQEQSDIISTFLIGSTGLHFSIPAVDWTLDPQRSHDVKRAHENHII